jgi:hypothetical protein
MPTNAVEGQAFDRIVCRTWFQLTGGELVLDDHVVPVCDHHAKTAFDLWLEGRWLYAALDAQ